MIISCRPVYIWKNNERPAFFGGAIEDYLISSAHSKFCDLVNPKIEGWNKETEKLGYEPSADLMEVNDYTRFFQERENEEASKLDTLGFKHYVDEDLRLHVVWLGAYDVTFELSDVKIEEEK